MQIVEVTQATAARPLLCAPLAFGVGSFVQADPFPLSASVSGTPELFVYEPTAVQVEVDAQATAERLESLLPSER